MAAGLPSGADELQGVTCDDVELGARDRSHAEARPGFERRFEHVCHAWLASCRLLEGDSDGDIPRRVERPATLSDHPAVVAQARDDEVPRLQLAFERIGVAYIECERVRQLVDAVVDDGKIEAAALAADVGARRAQQRAAGLKARGAFIQLPEIVHQACALSLIHI